MTRTNTALHAGALLLLLAGCAARPQPTIRPLRTPPDRAGTLTPAVRPPIEVERDGTAPTRERVGEIIIEVRRGALPQSNPAQAPPARRQVGDPLKNGTLIGLGTGFVFGFAAEGIIHGEGYNWPDPYSFALGGIGAGLGAAIGALIDWAIED